MENISKKIKKYKTKYKEGFTQSEIETFLKDFSEIDIDKFNKALGVVTCLVINDEPIFYRHDIEMALLCILENRDRRLDEWD